ncbi:MAG: HAD family hydrolase [Chloroflexi bacterium]|nr:HAD family hydrolase [Chloroflexota bacterium]
MIHIPIPDGPELALHHLALDLNGALAVDGRLLPGVAERIERLADDLDIHLLTANTHGGAADIAQTLGIELVELKPGPGGPQKEAFVRALGAASVVAIGNGANDAAMLRAAALGVAVVAAEGAALAAILAADVFVTDIRDALDLLLHPNRLRATLRT